MPRTEEANQRLREAQRARILESAMKVFARKGRSATIAEIAAEAEISQGLAYRYFASKDEIFQALVEQFIQSGQALFQNILEAPGMPGQRLDLLLSRLLEGLRQRPEFFQLREQVLGDETTADSRRELLRMPAHSVQDVMRQLIVEGQATGEVAGDDPDQLVTAVSACLAGLTRLAVRNPAQFQERVPNAGILLRMLKPDSARAGSDE
jgi:AcrR family transcriptional regulator